MATYDVLLLLKHCCYINLREIQKITSKSVITIEGYLQLDILL